LRENQPERRKTKVWPYCSPLAAWHKSWFVPNNATLIVAGDVTMERLKPELERAFGSWKSGTAPKKQLDILPHTAGKKVYLIDKSDAP
jgi:zinc protease